MGRLLDDQWTMDGMKEGPHHDGGGADTHAEYSRSERAVKDSGRKW